MGNIKYKYSVFSGLGEINVTDHILDGNKYTIKVSTGMGLLDKEYKTEVELTNEEMTAIEEMFRELGEYSKDPASKESAMIYDAGYSISGSSDEYEQFEMHNNEKATHIANKIDEMVKNNHKEFDEMYATIDADIFEANERFRKQIEAQNQGLSNVQAQEMSSKVPEMQEFKDNAQKMIDEGLGTHVIYDIPEPDINLDNEMPEVTVDQDLVNSLSGLLREKYPSLYDENGTLKPEAMDIIDLLIKTYIPEITATTEKEQEQPEAVPHV